MSFGNFWLYKGDPVRFKATARVDSNIATMEHTPILLIEQGERRRFWFSRGIRDRAVADKALTVMKFEWLWSATDPMPNEHDVSWLQIERHVRGKNDPR